MKEKNKEDTVFNNPFKRSALMYKISTATFTLLAVCLAIYTLYPYLFSIIASLRGGFDIYSTKFSLSELSLYAYERILFGITSDESIKLWQWMWNTAFVSVVTTFLTLLVSAMGGYALARIKFKGSKVLLAIILGVMMIPGQITLIPKYIIIANFLKWGDSYLGLIVPAIFSAYFTFMMRQFFLSFPKEVEEAAILDGMSRVGVFFKMLLPLSKAPLLAAGTLIFMGTWNSYLWPKLLINDSSRYLLSQGMTVLMGGRYTNTPAVSMAAAIISTLPLILLFMIFQKQFIGSIAQTGSKGA